MSLEATQRRLESALPRLLKDALQRGTFQLAASIETFLDEQGPPAGSFSTSSRLGAQSGALSRSLIPGQPGNRTRFDVGKASGTVTSGIDEDVIPYAKLHEFGGTVTTTERQLGFFWAKLRETGHEMWRAIALKAKHQGQLDYPARPFYRPGFEHFKRTQWPKLQQDMMRKLIAEFNR